MFLLLNVCAAESYMNWSVAELNLQKFLFFNIMDPFSLSMTFAVMTTDANNYWLTEKSPNYESYLILHILKR